MFKSLKKYPNLISFEFKDWVIFLSFSFLFLFFVFQFLILSQTRKIEFENYKNCIRYHNESCNECPPGAEGACKEIQLYVK